MSCSGFLIIGLLPWGQNSTGMVLQLILVVLGSTELLSRMYFPDWNRDCHRMISNKYEKLRI